LVERGHKGQSVTAPADAVPVALAQPSSACTRQSLCRSDWKPDHHNLLGPHLFLDNEGGSQSCRICPTCVAAGLTLRLTHTAYRQK
jgi:hypothetical protein